MTTLILEECGLRTGQHELHRSGRRVPLRMLWSAEDIPEPVVEEPAVDVAQTAPTPTAPEHEGLIPPRNDSLASGSKVQKVSLRTYTAISRLCTE